MQYEIHAAKSRNAIYELDTEERTALEALLLLTIKRVVLGKIIVGREQKAAGAASGIANRLARLRGHHVHDGGDKWARREVLACPTLHVLGVLLQQAFVGIALHISG